jgi:hypothetical protein
MHHWHTGLKNPLIIVERKSLPVFFVAFKSRSCT